MKKFFSSPQNIYLWTLGLIFVACFFFFNWDYRYVDDYRLFLHNSSFEGFLSSHKWGFSRIIGNYFFGLFYLPQSNVLLNLAVVLCHLLNGVMIYRILSKKSSQATAFVSALLFISIPITSEAFLWALAGQVVYAVFFFLLGVNFYLRNQDSLTLKKSIVPITLFILSISFYEVFILFPFFFLLVCWWQKRQRVFAFALSLVSASYLFLLKLVLGMIGANLNAQLKTTPIAFSDVPHRVLQITKDVTNIFVGKVALQMYSGSFKDILANNVPWHLLVVLTIFVLIAFVYIWFLQKREKVTTGFNTEVTFLVLLIGFSIAALLTIPVNYFHDLRTFYPLTICLALFVAEFLRFLSQFTIPYKVALSSLLILIAINIAVLRVENTHYVNLYQIDWKFIQQLEKDYQNGKTTIIYLPGYNSSRPLETQMNLAYYPESNFIYGTHLLSAASIKFTRTPYLILGTHQEILMETATDPNKYMVYDFVERNTLPVTEFLSTNKSNLMDLTALSAESYTFVDMPHDIKKFDAAVIFNRKLYKTIITHPNCSDQPATVEIMTPQLTSSCELSFRLFNVKDTENRTISDGTKVEVFINDQKQAEIPLKAVDPQQPQSVYTYAVTPEATGSARIKFSITDGGNKNCNDDKIFIAQPVLNCQ